MSDQADRLRQLVGARRAAATFTALADDEPAPPRSLRESASPRTTRSLLFTSGKGGVGTSNLVLNLAIALGELGQRVVVVDADIGLANLDLLCGLTPRYDLGDVLAGRCRLVDAVVTGPGEIQIVPGAHAIRTGAEDLGEGPARLVAELGELEAESDFVLVDAGSGLGPGVDHAGRGGRPGGHRQHARADLDRRRTRGDQPVPPADRPASAAGAGQSGRVGLRGGRGPRPAGRLEPAVPGRRGFAARDRVRSEPTLTSAWRSAAAGRS